MPTGGTHRVAAGLAPCAIQLPERREEDSNPRHLVGAHTVFETGPVPLTGFPSNTADEGRATAGVSTLEEGLRSHAPFVSGGEHRYVAIPSSLIARGKATIATLGPL